MSQRTFVLAVVGSLATLALAAPAGADLVAPDGGPSRVMRPDNLPNPKAERQAELRKAAVEKLMRGKATTQSVNGTRVIKLSGKGKKGKYVQYDAERNEKILTFLVDFGDKQGKVQGGTPGPVHNQIPEPDRTMDGEKTDDNSTLWRSDFNVEHYKQLMFGAENSFKDFYAKQSNGRFSVSGDVADWVKVPYNEARYGHNPVEGDGTSEAEQSTAFIADSATAWVEKQKASGKSDAEIKQYLQQFDEWDRYDHDEDGNFNEPDGYIDHFQAIHAGEGEEGGGGAQGEDAIWSHRWYAAGNRSGQDGPANNKAGGVPLGNTGLWIGDYTTEPENGGLGVFTHEFGHDLGLPDLYDTTNKATNGTSFWSLMSAGSWLNDGTTDIGSEPGYMGPWEKLQLGWLDAVTVPYGRNQKVALGPSDRDSAKLPQAAIVQLPDKSTTKKYNTPYAGSQEWWGGSADDLNSTLTRTVDLTGKKSATLSTKAWYDIEPDYDFLYVEVSEDGGKNWKQVGKEVTGSNKSWTDLSWDLSAYAGKKVDIRFRYSTDGGMHLDGPFLDDIKLTADGADIFTDGAENGDNGWTAKGFSRTSGTVTKKTTQYYLAENRQYNGYDRFLKTGPYNFGFLNTQPRRVEHLPFQNGMLLWYVDNAYEDNNVSQHPGHGQALPVDSRAKAMTWANGSKVSNKLQTWDAPFSRRGRPALTLHQNGAAKTWPAAPGVATFDDSAPDTYYDKSNPYGSTLTAGSGVKISVSGETKDRANLSVSFRK